MCVFFMVKDIVMVDVVDFGLMIWDVKSIGMFGNVIELLNC